jgi:autotransporter-associated beta strand protein
MKPTPRFIAASAAFAATLASVANAQALWTNALATGAWGAAGNWNPAAVPANNTAVQFGDGSNRPGSVSMGNTTRDVSTFELINTAGSYDFIPGGATGGLRVATILNNSSSASGNTISTNLHARGTNATNTLTLSGTGSASLTISSLIVDQSGTRATALSKTSSGVLIFSGTAANTYTAGTTVSAGRLELSKTAGLDAISGSTLTISGGEVRHINANQINNSTAVTLSGGHLNLNNNAETLGALSISGSSTLSLGTGTLTLSGASTTFASGQTLNLGISSLASFGRIDAGANALSFAGMLNVTGTHSFTAGDSFNLFDGVLSGTFSSVSLPSLSGGLQWDTSSLYATGVISVIPEPSAFAALAGLGVVGFAVTRRRRR